jgi:hypothetical protein
MSYLHSWNKIHELLWGHCFHPQNYPPKIDAKLVKKDNSNIIKIGCTTLDGAFLRNGCNQQKIAAKQFGELFL